MHADFWEYFRLEKHQKDRLGFWRSGIKGDRVYEYPNKVLYQFRLHRNDK
ncbi:hypothetical protein QT971_02725 [Microcoleus sp. herbarium19]